VVLLLFVGVALGGAVAAGAEAVQAATGDDLIGSGAAGTDGADPGAVALSLRIDGDTVALTHEAGPTLRFGTLRLVVAVDGRPLRHQPPVPFFAARGFRGGPTGPFNVASDGNWSAGETGSFRLASTNGPRIASGSVVAVDVYVDDRRVSRVRGTAD
jgi:hypothetical protein